MVEPRCRREPGLYDVTPAPELTCVPLRSPVRTPCLQPSGGPGPLEPRVTESSPTASCAVAPRRASSADWEYSSLRGAEDRFGLAAGDVAAEPVVEGAGVEVVDPGNRQLFKPVARLAVGGG